MTDLVTRAILGTKFQQRRNDLLEDGYRVLFEHIDDFGVFTKLRHRNGTIIVITCDYGEKTIRQKTNGQIVHTETLCEP